MIFRRRRKRKAVEQDIPRFGYSRYPSPGRNLWTRDGLAISTTDQLLRFINDRGGIPR